MNKTKIKKKLNESGFTILELIVAIAILAFVLAPAFSAFVITAKTNNKSTNILKATELSGDIMELLQSTGLNKVKDNWTGTLSFTQASGSARGTWSATATVVTPAEGETINSIDTLKDHLVANELSGQDSAQKMYKYGDVDAGFFVSLINVPYSNGIYDMIVYFKKVSSGQKFVWKVEIDVWGSTSGYHFTQNRLCIMTGKIMN